MHLFWRRASDITTWLPTRLHDQMLAEAQDRRPCESGGILLGYHPDTATIVISELIEAGPRAKRRRSAFEPDGEWQEREVAKAYEQSGRVHTYLGDWHSHPAGAARPSRRDKATARKIAKHHEARAPRPLMLIVAHSRDEWSTAVYRLEGKEMTRLRLQLYEG